MEFDELYEILKEDIETLNNHLPDGTDVVDMLKTLDDMNDKYWYVVEWKEDYIRKNSILIEENKKLKQLVKDTVNIFHKQ